MKNTNQFRTQEITRLFGEAGLLNCHCRYTQHRDQHQTPAQYLDLGRVNIVAKIGRLVEVDREDEHGLEKIKS